MRHAPQMPRADYRTRRHQCHTPSREIYRSPSRQATATLPPRCAYRRFRGSRDKKKYATGASSSRRATPIFSHGTIFQPTRKPLIATSRHTTPLLAACIDATIELICVGVSKMYGPLEDAYRKAWARYDAPFSHAQEAPTPNISPTPLEARMQDESPAVEEGAAMKIRCWHWPRDDVKRTPRIHMIEDADAGLLNDYLLFKA